jgi:subtilisin family serine protease
MIVEQEPVDSSDQRIAGTLTPAGPKLAYGIDLNWNQDMLSTAYAQRVLSTANALTHGMGTYGIIAGEYDAASTWGGIASNTTQMFIRVSSLRLADLSDMLFWLSTPTGLPSPACMRFPKPPLADVIYIAISSTSSLPRALRETADVITADTVVVYPAGNDSGAVAWLAEHPGVLSVGNTCYSQANNTEVKCPASNFGPHLSLCAMGEGAKSLTYGANGTQIFGGTSAAAPMVAATAALLKSVNPNLSPSEIRDILCLTVDKVDGLRNSGDGQWTEPDGSGGRRPVAQPPPAPRSDTRSDWYGYGRLNVSAAIQEAINRLP